MSRRGARRALPAAVGMLVACTLAGCVQVGDYLGGESEERCVQRAASLQRYVQDAHGLDDVSLRSSGLGSAGQCTVEGTVELPASATPQEIVRASVLLVESVEISNYLTGETDLVMIVGDERLTVLPQR